MANFLHGTEVLEISEGPRSIRTVSSSVIGLVGSGESDGVVAKVDIGALNGKLTFTAKAEGAAGNGITILAVNPGTNNATLSITVTGKEIKINLATDGSGVATSTATLVRAAVAASTPASALVTCALGSGSSGASLYAAHAATNLTGGTDASFPLDTPVLVTNFANVDTQLGADSYLGKALEAISKQTGAVVIVVRTAETDGGDSTSFTGVFSLKRAQSDLGYTPRILVVENADDAAIIASIKPVANSLRAIAVVGISLGEAPTSTDATGWMTDNGNERVYALWPSINGGEDPAPYVAGAIARSDNERGFWWSPSNFEVFGINSLDMPVDFQLGDPTSLANILNEGNVTTFIKEGGFQLWGNRGGSVDPKWAFLCIRRTGDILNDSVQRAHRWAVDRGITKTYFSDVSESVNAYMRDLKRIGAILGGQCFPTPGANTAQTITQGNPDFTFDWGGVYPAERVTFRSKLVNSYVEEIFA